MYRLKRIKRIAGISSRESIIDQGWRRDLIVIRVIYPTADFGKSLEHPRERA